MVTTALLNMIHFRLITMTVVAAEDILQGLPLMGGVSRNTGASMRETPCLTHSWRASAQALVHLCARTPDQVTTRNHRRGNHLRRQYHLPIATRRHIRRIIIVVRGVTVVVVVTAAVAGHRRCHSNHRNKVLIIISCSHSSEVKVSRMPQTSKDTSSTTTATTITTSTITTTSQGVVIAQQRSHNNHNSQKQN